VILGQPRQKSLQDPLLNGWNIVAQAYYSSDDQKIKIGSPRFMTAWAKGKTYLQNNHSKNGWRHGSN
jgi:hypothetical protein